MFQFSAFHSRDSSFFFDTCWAQTAFERSEVFFPQLAVRMFRLPVKSAVISSCWLLIDTQTLSNQCIGFLTDTVLYFTFSSSSAVSELARVIFRQNQKCRKNKQWLRKSWALYCNRFYICYTGLFCFSYPAIWTDQIFTGRATADDFYIKFPSRFFLRTVLIICTQHEPTAS